MAKKNRNTLKNYFKAGKIPTEQHYEELIDSMLNLQEDGIENSNKDIKVTEGLLMTSGSCLNATSVHYRRFSEGFKIQTSLPFALTVEGPPILIIEGYNFTKMKTIGLMVPFEYKYDAAFTIKLLDQEELRQEIARLSKYPISSELLEVRGKKPDPKDESQEIEATWIVDAKQPTKIVWELITNNQDITKIVESDLTELNTLAGLSIKTNNDQGTAVATSWGTYNPALKLSVEENKMTLLVATGQGDQHISFNMRAIGGKIGYENWYKGWTVSDATEEELSDNPTSEVLQALKDKQWSVDVAYAT